MHPTPIARSPRFHHGRTATVDAFYRAADQTASPLDRAKAWHDLNQSAVRTFEGELKRLLKPVATEETPEPIGPFMATEEVVEACLGPSTTTKVDTQPNPQSSSRSLKTLARVAGLGATVLFLAAACSGGNPTPKPDLTPTPVVERSPSNSPTPDVTITPIPPPSETPTVGPTSTATPSKGPGVTISPTQRVENDKLFAALKQWTLETGNTGIPLNKEWFQSGSRQTLSLSSLSKETTTNSNYTPEYYTLDVGTLILNDENGAPHLVLPIPQVDGVGNHYFLILNCGPLNSEEPAPVTVIPNRVDEEFSGQPQWFINTKPKQY